MTVRRVPIRFAAGVVMMAALVSCSDEQTAEPRRAPAKVQVGAQTLRPQSVTLTTQLPGRTSAHVVSEVRPRVGGIVRTRNFEEGTNVNAGDILYELDPAPFEAAYRNAEAALQRANGAIPSAEARLKRYMSLTTRNAVSQQDLDEAQTTMLQAEADVAAASAALETARINLEYTKIRAPIDGRIDASSVTPGALVTADQAAALATIRQLATINVDVVQSSANLLRVKKAIAENSIRANGDYVTVELLMEDGSRYPHPGKLQFSESSVSTTAGTVSIRALFPNPDGLLMPGMYVRAIVEEGVRENGFLLPQRAVSRNPRGEAIAKFVNAESKIEERILAIDRSIGNNWLVNGGIESGDRLVVDGFQRAQTGQDVQVTAVRIDDATGEAVAVMEGGEPAAGQANSSNSSSGLSLVTSR
ncbi:MULTISPECIES: efflux RND transporter periplasmic adaptor subunit [unclassified Agrobacterium]|uniref:efflux RND transporter periplasmic adaptor subunit n=1 Tax=unclassified Agrobacterium TaxID=2632611 RepID=UPI002449A222|nr:MULTISPECIES: efflux RND transporter periplasmic adaptor subunit [unclassified Agrobacterium]MDH0617029.1 efflux RND transporter periplasmic adaptor subunit [Agrobacterium sp. GD03872]MDH0699787.1 efflux RND transporter periplasmic adaptor subunit [Agrobacterium sp. GD03871]MDH1061019.1 efflux RND transporter periplasmic adaptor subunit [Agrobacterium sp. GD03992]MDH2211565.1 efflux RND transporter periplasmic adaptor subunit [Agrobacterium sp. GD03643]MDH2221188.1 efflux RND transporter pe